MKIGDFVSGLLDSRSVARWTTSQYRFTWCYTHETVDRCRYIQLRMLTKLSSPWRNSCVFRCYNDWLCADRRAVPYPKERPREGSAHVCGLQWIRLEYWQLQKTQIRVSLNLSRKGLWLENSIHRLKLSPLNVNYGPNSDEPINRRFECFCSNLVSCLVDIYDLKMPSKVLFNNDSSCFKIRIFIDETFLGNLFD